MVKQPAENGQKFLCDEDATTVTSLVPGVKNIKLQKYHELDHAH